MPLNFRKNHTDCERCQQPFICNPADIVACGCTKIYLTPEELSYVATQYSNCICNSCLLLLRDEFLANK